MVDFRLTRRLSVHSSRMAASGLRFASGHVCLYTLPSQSRALLACTRLPTQTSLSVHSSRHPLSHCGNFHHKEFIMYTAFTPGAPWLDTDGKRIQAHGGQIFQENGTYYWLGENKDHTTGEDEVWTWGVRLYSSNDLMNWQDEGLIVPPDLENRESILHPARHLDRPHLLFNGEDEKVRPLAQILRRFALRRPHGGRPQRPLHHRERPLFPVRPQVRRLRPLEGTRRAMPTSILKPITPIFWARTFPPTILRWKGSPSPSIRAKSRPKRAKRPPISCAAAAITSSRAA